MVFGFIAASVLFVAFTCTLEEVTARDWFGVGGRGCKCDSAMIPVALVSSSVISWNQEYAYSVCVQG